MMDSFLCIGPAWPDMADSAASINMRALESPLPCVRELSEDDHTCHTHHDLVLDAALLEGDPLVISWECELRPG